MSFGRLGPAAGARPMGEINMTPLIDVMLVLLVIFIITAPLMGSALRLDLPEAERARPSDAPAFVSVALDAQGRLHLGDQPVELAALQSRLREAAAADPSTEVQLRADRSVPYGRVAELLALVQDAGLVRIGFITEAAASAPR